MVAERFLIAPMQILTLQRILAFTIQTQTRTPSYVKRML